ncbi:MAG: MBL fold metallo-hydrolase [Clostridiales bacterium]|nr:MBL fold metallo-hydrolase [Clostridiales bacterium]
MIKQIKYGTTNTYLINGTDGSVLFDTGWAGTMSAFCHAMGEAGEAVQDIKFILISHYHPDHMGIAQEIADMGPVICAADCQRNFIHSSDKVLLRDKRCNFTPIKDEDVRFYRLNESRALLKEAGVDGSIYATPGHSDDSISLMLDSGELFVGDLNPLYELELHKGTQIETTWNMLLSMNPRHVYYGHAPSVDLKSNPLGKLLGRSAPTDIYGLVKKIVRYVDKGTPKDVIVAKTGADPQFVEDVTRMYVTHPGVTVQGILDRVELRRNGVR